MKLLLHCCCGPCSIACIENLSSEGLSPALFWYNPNIQPLTEYQHRRDGLHAFVSAHNQPLEIVDTNVSTGTENETLQNCESCYRLRLEKTAAHAVEQGFNAFSTTLLISPYQQHETIHRLGEELAAQYGIEFVYRDFRPLFREGQTKARALGLYMQKYCGCTKNRDQGSGIRDQGIEGRHHRNAPVLSSPVPGPRSPIPFFDRLELLTGTEVLEKLAQTKALVFGLGGVGSWCAEALVRSGVGRIGIVDYDTVCESNVNRQVQATSRTLGRVKAEALKERLLEIHPRCEVTAWGETFSRENAASFGIENADYVIDAIDSLTHKLDLIETSCSAGTRFYSSMGMAKKLDPTCIKTGSIWETQVCPLARLVRQGLRKRGFDRDFTVVYSDEQPLQRASEPNSKGSIVTVTAAAGMILASLVLRDVMGSLVLPCSKGNT
ncbi:MAG: epoxyqueuosine reductase QueH [Treponema sp.]|nr:epoxyqueuosine reductase QueH [Treponema sp.]